MPKYILTIPIAGYAYKEIEAPDKTEALEELWENGLVIDDIIEWDMFEHIIEGNVCHAPCNNISIQKIHD